MDFKVGSTSRIGSPAEKQAGPPDQIEARVLAIREPRKESKAVHPHSERRKGSQRRDPRHGRILVLMIPDGHRLPSGLDRGTYRVFLRFARR
jgi:hypothetical protein